MNNKNIAPIDALRKTEQVFSFALLGIGLVVVFTQLRSLFHFPLYDSYLWWGDESWLMLEFKEQLVHGVLRHPLALGATIHYSNGLLLSNMWITALVYGLPQILVSSMDPVSIGRIVTGLLSTALLVSTFYILRKHGVSMMLASLALVLLVTSRSFLLTSHSARYDILTALVLLWIVHVVSTLSKEEPTRLHIFLYGLALPLTLLISHHVLILSFAVFICAFLKIGALRKMQTFLTVLLGVTIASSILIGVYLMFTGSLQLFNSTPGQGFLLNVHEMPILRPFSRSVQIANLVQRWQTITFLSPLVLAFAVIVFTTWLTTRLRQGGKRNSRTLSPTTISLILVTLSWLFFESSAPTSYLIYVLPIILLSSTVAMQRILGKVNASVGLSATALFLTFVVGVAIAVMGYRDTVQASQIGLNLTISNKTACYRMHEQIVKDAAKQGISVPLVLTFNPAVNRLLQFQDIRLMTTHFIEYPLERIPADSVVTQFHAAYLLVYASALKPLYMREVGPLREIADRNGVLIANLHGKFTDIGRSYFVDDRNPAEDTLLLYRLRN